MTDLILRPDPATRTAWGILSHVDAIERDRILNLPGHERKRVMADLERRVREEKKRKGIR